MKTTTRKTLTKSRSTLPLLDDEIYEMQADLCSALANPVRLKILDLIANTEMTHTDLLEVLQIPKPNLTQHLKVLKDAGLVRARKDGLFQHCSLEMPQIKTACQMIRQLLVKRLDQSRSQHAKLSSALQFRLNQ